MQLLRKLLALVKTLYDLVASYALGWTLYFATVAAILQVVFSWVVELAGFESSAHLWSVIDRGALSSAWLRIAIFGLLQIGCYLLLYRQLKRAARFAERFADRVIARYRSFVEEHPWRRRIVGGAFTLFITALGIPFILQPNLVPLEFTGRTWRMRLVNLVDGSASIALIESTVGLYRREFADPIVGEPVSRTDLEYAFGRGAPQPKAKSAQPIVDRWDPLIRQVVGDDQRSFALLKAFVWVESGGRQYAVSYTGCLGLMQFCSRTARSGAFRSIFGVGNIYPCRCGDRERRCRIEKPLQLALETAEREKIIAAGSQIACDLIDARFDPQRSLAAGWHFISELDRKFGNLYLDYVGYNSGPPAARRLFKALDENRDASLRQIRTHLEAALAPSFPKNAARRARSLGRKHLPKLRRAYRVYLAQAQSSDSTS